MIGGYQEKGRTTRKRGASSGTQTTKSSDTFESVPSKHPAEQGIRARRGKWEYRFNFHGKPYSLVTDLAAVPENILKAQTLKEAHLEQLRKGKNVVRQMHMPVANAIREFMVWYRSEHPLGGECKWAKSLMASFDFYVSQSRLRLVDLGPSDIEGFKVWRRETGIRDNSLRKQLLLMREFFLYSRKRGWMLNDPFALGEEIEVKIPAERDSTAMHVLSLDEEKLYLSAANEVTIDLSDVATIMKEQGPRPDEVLSLEQRHVDLFQRHFTIWDNTDEGKSKNAHRRLRMTEETFRVFARRLSKRGPWVFPSSKNDFHRTTLQKAHEYATRGVKDKKTGEYVGGCRVGCRLYDMRHTFATRFALAGGLRPVLSKIPGHADLAMLNKYVHPSQQDMDRAMQWYSDRAATAVDMQSMLIETEGYQNPAALVQNWSKTAMSGKKN
jgi:integrase